MLLKKYDKVYHVLLAKTLKPPRPEPNSGQILWFLVS